MNTCEHQPSSFSTKPSKTYYKYTPLKLSPFNSKLCFLPSIFSNFQKTSNFETYGEIVIKVDMGGPGSSPCASCKLLRRRCAKECIFAPYFPPDDPHKFAIVHKVFGASNVSKMLQELPVHQRADAVNSLVFEANARVRDPVYGCVGAISYLQNQVTQLQMQLAVAQTEILCIQMQHEPTLQSHHEVFELHQDDKAHLLHSNNNSINNCNNNNYNLAYAMSSGQLNSNFASPSSVIQMQMQDPLKQESLWT